MSRLRINEEVYYETAPQVRIDSDVIEFLKTTAGSNRRKRARICLHKSEQDQLHEMLITHAQGNYIPPHRHIGKGESYHILQGSIRLITFDDLGNVEQAITLSPYPSRAPFYCRLPEGVYHSLLILSDMATFLESTTGPFHRSDTVFASWAPPEEDKEACKQYLASLLKRT